MTNLEKACEAIYDDSCHHQDCGDIIEYDTDCLRDRLTKLMDAKDAEWRAKVARARAGLEGGRLSVDLFDSVFAHSADV